MLKILKRIKKKVEQETIKYAQKNIDEMARILNRPREGEIVKIENIKIPNHFVQPRKAKLDKKEEYYKKNGYFKSTIILNKDNLLLDGYTTYLLASKFGYDYITILRED